jgi:hypothetical protein
MANRWYTQFFGTLHKKPVMMDCSFVVDASNGNGLGIRSLKGPGIAQVYMHTSATPATGNPNPAAGIIVVQFQDNFNRYLFGTSGFVSPVSGTPISISGSSVLTVGAPYIITSVGTSVQADWAAVGLPLGIIPAVGQPFIASVTGGGTGTGVVMAPSKSGIMSIEVLGDPNLTLGSKYNGAAILGGSAGSYMVLQCLNASGTITAPAAGSVVGLSFFMNNSSILVQGT